MRAQEVVVKPYKWTLQQAFSGGRLGYRIGVELNGNPFKGSLGDAWLKGWRDAFSKDPHATSRKINYAELEDSYEDRRPRTRTANRSRKENRRSER